MVPVLTIFYCVLGLSTAVAAAGPGASPRVVGYQGYLEQAGAPVTGTVTMVFRFADDADAAANTLSWSETKTVEVVNGNFSVLLGQSTPIGDDVLDSADLYVTMEVEGVPLGNAQRITPSLQALRADRAVDLVSDSLTTGPVSASSVSATGSISAGAVSASSVSATGNISAATVSASSVSTTGNMSAATVSASSMSTTGNVSVGGTLSAGLLLHTCPRSNPQYGVGYGVAECACPSGYQVLSGGGSCASGFMHQSRPISKTRWRVSCAAGETYTYPKWITDMTLLCARIN